MDFFSYYKQISSQQLPKINLLYGFERYLLDNSVKYIESNYLNPIYKEMNLSVMEGNLNVDELASLISALPFFDRTRLIIIRNAQCFKQEVDKKLFDLLDDIPDGVYILFIEKEVDKRKKLYKIIDKIGCVVNFEKLSQKEFQKWTVKKFKEYHGTIDSHTLNYFIEMVNYLNPESPRNLYEVEQYINALSNLKEPITQALVDKYVEIPIENNIFKMMDALSSNKMKEVLFIFNHLVENGEAEIKIFFMMSSQFRNIYKCKQLMAAGHSSASIASKLGIHPFVAKKASHFAGQFSNETLTKIMSILEKMDRDLKSSGVRPQLIIEKGILEIYMAKKGSALPMSGT
ncbi:MAG: polymerase subunit delta [Clostridiales bacterium]|jgi:DNA polymerase-3 subunit delta|nr:polymerase subunit delta [Clostridiales bacterium]MDN5299830.1 polymerase subunit delta [Clostridiales bacterium]